MSSFHRVGASDEDVLMGMRLTVEPVSRHPRIRLAWTGFVVALIVWAITVVGYARAEPGGTSEWGGSTLLANLPFLLMILSFDVVGLLITTRRPGNAVGWLVLGIGFAWAAGDVLSALGSYAFDHGWSNGDVLLALSEPTWLPPIALSGTFLILLFPDGHLPSPRWRWFAWTIAVGVVVVGFAILFAPGTFEDSGYPSVSNPLAIESLAPLLDALLVSLLIIPAGMIGSAVALVQRYRRSAGAEREQLKWLAYAAAIVALTFAGVMVATLVNDFRDTPPWLSVFQSLSLATFTLIPIAIGFAVLKYRLYDIDVVINRTIVFGALALFIGAVYVAIVVVLGGAVGARASHPLLSIGATALIAVLFEPARSRVQRFANRLVYGERATPYEILTRFSERLGGTYAIEDVLPRTARVIAEASGAARVVVWLRAGDALRAAAAWPAEVEGPPPEDLPLGTDPLPPIVGADAVVPVRHRDELLGAVSVTKPPGEPLSQQDHVLLGSLADQAGLVLSNVALTSDLEARLRQISARSAELRASRQRIVATQDAERRRLERNIHDGAQQHLVALAVKLRLARGMLLRDPDRGGAMLTEIRAEIDDAMDTLSSLALGIYPPILEEHGIAAALEAQGGVASIPVRVRASGIDRQPIETEAAVYFCCLEAMQNAAKHARASLVEVMLGLEGGVLTFTVRDDEVGFDAAGTQTGSGLQGMSDRLAAVGGSVEITSSPGGGTLVAGRVPAVVFA